MKKSVIAAFMLLTALGLVASAHAGGAYVSIGVPAVVGVYPTYYSPCYSACGGSYYEYYAPAYVSVEYRDHHHRHHKHSSYNRSYVVERDYYRVRP